MEINPVFLFGLLAGSAAFGLFMGIIFSAREASKTILAERDRAMIYKDRADKLEGVVEDLRIQIMALKASDDILPYIGTKLDEAEARITGSVPGTVNNSFERGIRHGLQIVILHMKGAL